MKKYGIVASVGAGIILLIIGYFVLIETKVTPLTLRVGKSVPLIKGNTHVGSTTGTLLKCGTIQSGTALFTDFYAESNGVVTVATDDTDSRADTLLRIKYNNVASQQACNDDISSNDKRSKISKFPVFTNTADNTRIKYTITIGIKANTTDYPIKYSVLLEPK